MRNTPFAKKLLSDKPKRPSPVVSKAHLTRKRIELLEEKLGLRVES